MDITIKQEARRVVLIGIKLFFAHLVLPRKYYNRFLNKQAKSISSLHLYAEDLIGAIKFSKKISRNYKNSYAETENLVHQFSCFRPFYLNMVAEVKEQRKKFKLTV